MKCAYHPDREPVGACVACGRLICVECKALLGGKIYCTPCADKIFVQSKPETTRLERAEAITNQQPKVEAQTEVVISRPEPVNQIATNTSGQGSAAVLPDELKGWNWGAFFLTWIWGIGNGVWIAFVSFVLGFIWAIVLGIKGNEWAWQHKKWGSIEHFKKTQRTWKKWGIGLFIAGVVIGIIYAIIVAVIVATGIGQFSL
jgi:DNA-directed RNA polymerase subunit RPC12/RpoP